MANTGHKEVKAHKEVLLICSRLFLNVLRDAEKRCFLPQIARRLPLFKHEENGSQDEHKADDVIPFKLFAQV